MNGDMNTLLVEIAKLKEELKTKHLSSLVLAREYSKATSTLKELTIVSLGSAKRVGEAVNYAALAVEKAESAAKSAVLVAFDVAKLAADAAKAAATAAAEAAAAAATVATVALYAAEMEPESTARKLTTQAAKAAVVEADRAFAIAQGAVQRAQALNKSIAAS